MAEPQYDNQKRMKYHPDFHAKHKTDWLAADEKYLIEHYDFLGANHCSMALERTVTTISERVCQLRKKGKMLKTKMGYKKGRLNQRETK